MYKVLFEVYVKGLPSEVECFNKIREVLESIGKCLGSPTAFVCFYKNSLVKVVPKAEEFQRRVPIPSHVYEPVQQILLITIELESDNIENLAEVIEQVYSIAKGCGLAIKLTG